TQHLHALDLAALERRVDAKDRRRGVLLGDEAVDADDDAIARLDLLLVAERRLCDLPLEEVLLDRRDDAAKLFDPLEVLVRLPLELVGQVLEEVRAAEGV